VSHLIRQLLLFITEKQTREDGIILPLVSLRLVLVRMKNSI